MERRQCFLPRSGVEMEIVRKRILILGSTGSIGTQALEVIADNPEKFEVVGIAAGGGQPDLLIRQAQALNLPPERVAVADRKVAPAIQEVLGAPSFQDLTQRRA